MEKSRMIELETYHLIKENTDKKFDDIQKTITRLEIAHIRSITELKVKMGFVAIIGSSIMSLIVGFTIKFVFK